MNRSAANAYITAKYKAIATDAQLETTDQATAYSTVIDMSLRALGYTEAELSTADVAQEKITAYYALLRYYTLNWFVDVYAVAVDTSINNMLTAARSQAFKALTTQMEKAAAECASLGYPVDAVGQNQTPQIGMLGLDFLESCTTGGEFGC